MTEGPINATRPAGNRGLRIALAVSVALNLAVLGTFAGAMLGPDGPRSHRNPADLGFGFYTEALLPEDRAELRRRFIASRPQIVEQRRAMRLDLDAVLVALRAEPFDPAFLDTALKAQTERLESRLVIGQTLLRDFLVDLPADARRAFADRLEAATTRRAPGRKGTDNN